MISRIAQLLAHEKSPYQRIEAPCPYFGVCGGCALQDLAYSDQLTLKQQRLRRAFAALGDVPAIDVVGLDDPWRYRSKAELTFSESGGELTLGYHAEGSFWRVVDLEDCLLLPQPLMGAVRDVRRLAAATGLPAYHPRTHQGFFRYLLVRHSRATGQMLFCLITASGSREPIEPIATEVMARHPALTGFYWGWTDRIADVALPQELVLLGGAPYLEDQIGSFRLRLHPLSFLQPASLQADRMYTFLAQSLSGTAGSVAWDLYCGVGLAGFYLSRAFGNVYGIDNEPHNLELATVNASLNGVTNIEFRGGKVETLLLDRRFWLQDAKPDVIVVDPPRAGLHPHALSSLLAARPRRLAYLSCNVQSLVRDLRPLLSSFPHYRLAAVTAFDMFPQTLHVETCVILERG